MSDDDKNARRWVDRITGRKRKLPNGILLQYVRTSDDAQFIRLTHADFGRTTLFLDFRQICEKAIGEIKRIEKETGREELFESFEEDMNKIYEAGVFSRPRRLPDTQKEQISDEEAITHLKESVYQSIESEIADHLEEGAAIDFLSFLVNLMTRARELAEVEFIGTKLGRNQSVIKQKKRQARDESIKRQREKETKLYGVERGAPRNVKHSTNTSKITLCKIEQSIKDYNSNDLDISLSKYVTKRFKVSERTIRKILKDRYNTTLTETAKQVRRK